MDDPQDLFAALRAGDADAVTALLDADPSALERHDANGLSPVLTAAYWQKPAVLALLLERGPALDPFEVAVVGAVDRLRALLDEEPGLVALHSFDGGTLLHFAAFFGHEAAVRLLLERGADVHARSRNAMCNLPLHAALAGPLSPSGVRALLEAGSPPDAKQQAGYTALHAAAMNGSGERVDLLLAFGADPAVAADDGRTAADFARERGHAELADRLAALASGAPA